MKQWIIPVMSAVVCEVMKIFYLSYDEIQKKVLCAAINSSAEF